MDFGCTLWPNQKVLLFRTIGLYDEDCPDVATGVREILQAYGVSSKAYNPVPQPQPRQPTPSNPIAFDVQHLSSSTPRTPSSSSKRSASPTFDAALATPKKKLRAQVKQATH